jgi:hypothetical protein
MPLIYLQRIRFLALPMAVITMFALRPVSADDEIFELTELAKSGRVVAAQFADFNGNGNKDLMLPARGSPDDTRASADSAGHVCGKPDDQHTRAELERRLRHRRYHAHTRRGVDPAPARSRDDHVAGQ